MAKAIRSIVPYKVEEPFDLALGIVIAKYAKKAGLLEEELATRAGCSPALMARYFEGTAFNWRGSVLKKLAEAFDMSLSALIYEAEHTNPLKHREHRDKWTLAGGLLNPRNNGIAHKVSHLKIVKSKKKGGK
jgi:transcriptional regulator with XRE-family HTH domain